jgi:hypothetical protein
MNAESANNLETAIMSADLTLEHIPIEVEEEKKMPDDTKQWLNMLRDEFSSLKGWLAGSEGQGGVLNDIKDDLVNLERGQRQIEDKLSSMVNTQIRDKAEADAKIAEVKADVNAVGNIAREAKAGLASHCEDYESKRRFRWELLLGIFGVLAGLAVAVIGWLV